MTKTLKKESLKKERDIIRFKKYAKEYYHPLVFWGNWSFLDTIVQGCISPLYKILQNFLSPVCLPHLKVLWITHKT